MNSDRDYAPLSIACVRALNDKLYEKRKAAALEIEKMVKDFAARNDTIQVKKILRVLGQDFALSQSPHARKGGLIGLAAVAIALGKDTAQHIPDLIQPILACFSDSDVKVRYCACESLYNVVKVARGAVLDYFTDIFSGLSNLATDPDQGVKNGSETLDRLMKDIVTESSTFDLVSFMPLLRERITTKNDFARQFIISWISVLDTVPQIDMVLVLPEILDGLFKILEDTKTEIKTMCGTLLAEFLRSIKQNPVRVDFQGMINILAQHAQSQDDLLQFTAITWIKEFVQLSDTAMLPYTSGILIAILPCLSYEVDSKRNIKETAKAVNFSLMRLISEDNDGNMTNNSLDLNSVTEVLTKFLMQTKVPTKVAVLKWIYHLHSKTPNRMFEHMEKLFPVLLKVLSDSSDEVVQQDLEVLAEIVSYQYNKGQGELVPDQSGSLESNKYFLEFINNLLRLFSTDRRLLEERGSFIIRQLCTLLNSEVIYMAFSKVLSQEKNVKFISTMIDYLNTILLTSSELFELRNRLKDLSTKESRDMFQSLYLCWCHNPVAAVALCFLSQNYAHACDLIRTLIYSLSAVDNCRQSSIQNCITKKITSLMNFTFSQTLLKELEGFLNTFEMYYSSMYSKITYSPDLNAHAVMSNIFPMNKISGDLEVTVEFLTEIDKLVQLIESPIFAYLRLELLEVPHNQHLVQALYGLLMLLPQTEAFHTLRQRLDCIPSLHLHENSGQNLRKDINQREKRFDFPQLLQHFTQIQEQHRKEKLTSRTINLLEKGVKNI